ncbi:MAG: hypothetical protein U5L72_08430 [Bacteroidales bacterium]|nr:hypothetical protein [Bacteroidales bacterium]
MISPFRDEVPGPRWSDGMCGSGTIVAEAGPIARNIAPGKFRKKIRLHEMEGL